MNTVWSLVSGAVQNVLARVFAFGSSLPRPVNHPPQQQRKNLSIEVVRPDDLLVVTFDFYNVTLTAAAGSAPAQLQRDKPGNVFLVAHLPPQSFGEQAFYEGEKPADSEPLRPPTVAARMAGASQLVFRVQEALLPLDFSLEQILDAMGQSEPVVESTIHQPSGTPPLGSEGLFGGVRSQFTAIEAPYRLVLSPNLESRWQHASQPASDAAGQRTELWHTRLTGAAPTVSAVWSPDYLGPDATPLDDNLPFRMSLTRRHRHQIVRSSADPNLAGAAPVNVRKLMLSSQGAWLDVQGTWNNTDVGLAEWRHIVTSGRDQYARVVDEGYLFPLCHRAVMVTITERKVEMGRAGITEGKPVAYLRQRVLIFVREPQRSYSHREIPFRTATLKTLVTRNLDDPLLTAILPPPVSPSEKPTGPAFWPKVSGKDVLFHVVATDWSGRAIEFHTPLAFIIKEVAEEPATAPATPIIQIIEKYNTQVAETDLRRNVAIVGQKVAFAPEVKTGDATLDTAALVLSASGAKALPRFLPWMFTAKVDIPAVREISGSPAFSTIKLDEKFTAGTGTTIGNMSDVFARLVGPATLVQFTADQTGGMVAPDFGVTGISRFFGPVGGNIDDFAAGKFDPAAMFAGVKLLGGIELSKIISKAINATPEAAGAKIPNLTSVRQGNAVKTKYHWDVDRSFLLNTGIFVPGAASRFVIEATLRTPLDGSAPDLTVHGELTDFAVVLLPPAKPDPPPAPPPPKRELIALNFTTVNFTAAANKKVDFAVVFAGFDFRGPLTFVNTLRDVIPMDGFDDPPFLDVILPPDPRAGVNVGFTQGIPTVGIGIFTLQNIGFSAGFFLPFLGDAANLRLAFCERHQPFTLTVSLFGGGGFFAIDIGFGGVKQIEAAFEFGAAVALNLGVAQGSASIMGGVYFQKSGEEFVISAYFRAAGSLSVLGIITVSVEFYLALTYASKGAPEHGGKLWGQASLTVKVKIAFFSKSVSISIEREFAGSDPTFAKTVQPLDWQHYCEAFADYPA